MDNIHATLLNLEYQFGDRYHCKDERSKVISKFSIKAKFEDEDDDFFDLDLKCLKGSRAFSWYLTEANESECVIKCGKFLANFNH